MQFSKSIFPITNIDNNKLSFAVNCSDKQFNYGCDLNLTDICLALNIPENLTNLFNKSSGFSSDIKQNSDNIKNCNYYSLGEIQYLNKLNDKVKLFACCLLFVSFYRLFVSFCLLLVNFCSLLVSFCLFLVTYCSLLVSFCLFLVTFCSFLVSVCSLLVTFCLLLVTFCLLLHKKF